MTTKTKRLLDYIPYSALIISAIFLVYSRINGEILFQIRHIIGLILIPIPFLLFNYRHKIGVLFLGFMLIIGLFGAISYSPAITTTTVGKGLSNGDSFTFLYFQPIFLLWICLHFIVSGRYYTGILSKKYWDNIKSDEPYIIDSK